jgi:hypothetical protein
MYRFTVGSIHYCVNTLPAGKDDKGIGIVRLFFMGLRKHLFGYCQLAKADAAIGTGPSCNVDPSSREPLCHILCFRFSSGMTFRGAISASDHKHFFTGFDISDDFVYWLLDCCVHKKTSCLYINREITDRQYEGSLQISFNIR